MTSQALSAAGAPTRAPRPPVFEAFNAGAPQITTNDRFTRHIRADGGVKWDDVLAEPGWSQSQRVLISIAAALCADARRPRADSART